MDCCEIAIIGSGPAGVSAAMALAGRGVTLIDVGHPTPPADATSSHPFGAAFEGLRHLADGPAVHPKMRGPRFSHVDTGERYEILNLLGERLLESRLSHARGGFAEAWGGQLLRYTPVELLSLPEWPCGTVRLDDHYEHLERHIGISGSLDALHRFLGSCSGLLPPLPLTPLAAKVLARYQRRRLEGRAGPMVLGRPRLAVLSRPHGGRPAYRLANDEFSAPDDPGLYRPSQDLDRLVARREIDYRPGLRLVTYREDAEGVDLKLLDGAGRPATIRARHVLIACGAAQSAAVVLRSSGDLSQHSVPFVDHPPTLLPIFFPAAPGGEIPAAYPIQLIASLRGGESFASIYSLHGMAPADRLLDLPCSMPAARRLLPHLLSRMMVAQIWDRTSHESVGRLRLTPDGISITMPSPQPSPSVPDLVRALRPLGGFTAERLASNPLPGWGYHHVGTLPMAHRPRALQTHADGRLWNSWRVRVIDGAALPSLPAKNPSLTIMANARRIALALADFIAAVPEAEVA